MTKRFVIGAGVFQSAPLGEVITHLTEAQQTLLGKSKTCGKGLAYDVESQRDRGLCLRCNALQ